MRILLVEDSRRLRETIALALKRSGYDVELTGDGAGGLELPQSKRYDVVILDIMLPGLDGIAVLEAMRQQGNQSPVLFLTAKDTVEDRVLGLRTGADDYLVKPFALDELLARVEVLGRLSAKKEPKKVLQVEDLKLDLASKSATRGGVGIELTAREFALLEHFMVRKGRMVSRTEIEDTIYDDLVSPSSNVVDAAVYALRKKITVREGDKPLIHTKRGQGYVLGDLV